MNQKSNRASRFCLLAAEVAGALLVLALLALAALALRLSGGPISLTPLLPLLERALDQDGQPVRLRAETADLAWERLNDGPTLTLGQVQISGLAALTTLTLRGLSVSLEPRALRHGVVAPRALQVDGLAATMTLPAAAGSDAAGQTPSTADTSGAAPSSIARQIESLIGRDGPLQRLTSVSVRDSQLTLMPAEAPPEGAAPPVAVSVHSVDLQRGTSGIAGTADITLSVDGSAGRIDLKAEGGDDGLTASATLAAFRPAELAGIAPAAAVLAAMDLPFSGTVSASVDTGGTLSAVTTNLTAGGGQLRVPADLAASLGLPQADVRLPVRGMVLRGSVMPAAMQASIDTAAITFGDDARIVLPEPMSQSLPPLRALDASARFKDDVLDIERLALEFPGPVVALSGRVQGLLSGAIAATLRATLPRGLAVNELKDYWPRGLATNAWDWVTARVRDGAVPAAEANLALSVSPQGVVSVDAFNGRFLVREATVDFLPPMPPVFRASAEATVDLTTLRFAISGGNCAGLSVKGGTVTIPDLPAETPSLDLDLAIAGPAAGVIEILAAEPLAVTEGLDLQPRQVMGSIDARLRARFPLLADLEFEQLDLDVEARSNGLGADDLLGMIDLRQGRIAFRVSESGLHAAGPISIAGIAGTLSWDEDFRKPPVSGRSMRFFFPRAEVAQILRQAPKDADIAKYVRGGSVSGSLIYADRGGVGSVSLDADLTAAELAVPELAWHKDIGGPADLGMRLRTLDGRPDGAQSFSLIGQDADVQGTAIIEPPGTVSAVNLSRFRLGRSDVTASMTATDDDGWDVFVGGSALDLSAISARKAPAAEAESKADGAEPPPGAGLPEDLTVSVGVNQLWMDDKEPLSPFLLTLVRRDGRWRQAQASGDTVSGRRFLITLRPGGDGTQSLSADVRDAGNFLRLIGVYGDMIGGHLTADVTLDDRGGVATHSGWVRINGFSLVNAPILARILSLMTLGGIANALTGEGILFSRLEAPFDERNGFLILSNAYAHGPSLGLTTTGSIDLNRQTLDLQGLVVPFFWANNLLGRLPLIGSWLTGGSPVGGIFSAPYTLRGSFSDPSVFVNPVTAIMPSVLRFTIEWLQEMLLRAGRPPRGLEELPPGP